MSRMQGYLETMSKLWRLAALDKASNAPIGKWVTRSYFDNQTHLVFHCADPGQRAAGKNALA